MNGRSDHRGRGTAYTQNATGNLVARDTDSFGYDQANRLTSASVGGTTTQYAYDGCGKWASKTVGSNPATSFVYDVNQRLPVVLDDGSRKYVYGAGLAYTVDGEGAISVAHRNGLECLDHGPNHRAAAHDRVWLETCTTDRSGQMSD